MASNIICLLRQLFLCQEQYGRAQVKHLGISPAQGMTLHYLFSCGAQTVSATQLHKEFGVSKSAISSTLKNLQEKGYLKERRHPEDDRKKQIILTDKAYALKAQLDQELAEQQACLCEGIPPQRLAALENELHTMLHNVRQQISRRTEP